MGRAHEPDRKEAILNRNQLTRISACVLLFLVACNSRSPDLTSEVAAVLISNAPEFNRYAKLVRVDSLTRQGDSLAECCCYGFFAFSYLNAPSDAPTIKAYADFRYWDGTWHFTGFDYGL